MNFLHLEYFVTTVRVGSTQGAADELFLSEQYITKSIRALERELCVPLIIKNRGMIALTYEGEVLYDFVGSIVADYAKLKELEQTLVMRKLLRHTNQSDLS